MRCIYFPLVRHDIFRIHSNIHLLTLNVCIYLTIHICIDSLTASGSAPATAADMTQLLKQKAMEQSLLLSASARSQNMSSSTSASTATNKSGGSGSGEGRLSPLASFLITRACSSLPLANSLYWFLKVETQDKENGSRFSLILESFLTRLKDYSGQEGAQRYKLILAQDTYVGLVIKCQQDAKEVSGAQPVKQAELRKLLAERQMNRISVHGLTAIPDPLRPYIRVTGLNPATARMFKSAVYPCMLEFDVLGGKAGGLSPRGMFVCLFVCLFVYLFAYVTHLYMFIYFLIIILLVTIHSFIHLSGGTPSVAGPGPGVNSSSPKTPGGSAPSPLTRGRTDGPSPGQPSGQPDEEEQALADAQAAGLRELPETMRIMFKSGDDLRQDQLIMQLMQLMDGLLRKVCICMCGLCYVYI